jgi:NADPH-dependent curcumin reductase CurA
MINWLTGALRRGVNNVRARVAKISASHVIVIGSNKNKLKLVESLGADVLIDRSGVGKITLAIG